MLLKGIGEIIIRKPLVVPHWGNLHTFCPFVWKYDSIYCIFTHWLTDCKWWDVLICSLRKDKEESHIRCLFFRLQCNSKLAFIPKRKACPPFLRTLFQWFLISRSQSLRSELIRGENGQSEDTPATFCCAPRMMPIHFFCAFCAALVTFPAEGGAFSTDLMTPTATVCLMSRTAKRPAMTSKVVLNLLL